MKKSGTHLKAKLSRIVSVILIIVLTFSLSISCFAEGDGQIIKEARSLILLKDNANPEPEKAIELLKPLAEAGNANAQYYLGYIYTIFGVNEISPDAVSLLTSASENGNLKANLYLAFLYSRGFGVQKDEEKAEKLAKAAVDAGILNMDDIKLCEDGYYGIGLLYANGLGVPNGNVAGMEFMLQQDAVKWFMKSAEAGNVAAMHNIGYYYTPTNIHYSIMTNNSYEMWESEKEVFPSNVGTGGMNMEKAIEYFTKAADAGYSLSMFDLAALYFVAPEIQNNNKGEEWCRKAAEYGNAQAMVALGNIYSNSDNFAGGDIDPVSIREGYEWYKKAAELGNARGMYKLGIAYEYGIFGEEDYEAAAEWYLKAAEMGDPKAMLHLGYMYEDGGKVFEQDTAKANEWLEKANAAQKSR